MARAAATRRVQFQLFDLPAGKVHLEATFSPVDKPGDHWGFVAAGPPIAASASATVILRGTGDHDNPPDGAIPESQIRAGEGGFVVVTAADETYFDRLANLVGSLQFWEPGTSIHVYDLGFSESSRRAVQSWRWTELLPVPFHDLPPHLGPGSIWMVAWKPWVVLHALRSYRAVLWLDANFEARQPLTELKQALCRDGYFFTTAGHRFPTPKTVRPGTLAEAAGGGCQVHSGTRVEYTSAAMGFIEGEWAHKAVLEPMHTCCLEKSCVWPPDAAGNTNQRRDQSVLNAVLCAEASRRNNSSSPASVRCHRSKGWWAWAGQETLVPPAEPGDWSEPLILFSRRNGYPKPYSPQLA